MVTEEWHDFLVEAEIFMLPTEISGRTRGITTGYMPNHNFGGKDNTQMRIGEVTVRDNEWISPGETKNVTIHFAMPSGYVVDLKKGLEWRIQEGAKHVANGKILFVYDPNS